MIKLIDIHTHIIPHVDDGSRSFEESLEIIEKMINDGITTIFATPHIQSPATKSTRLEQITNFNILKEKTKDLNVDLILAAEVLHRDLIKTDYSKYTMGETNYILIEFHWSIPTDVLEVIYNLTVQGYKPIVAHVERYPYLKKQDYLEIINNGGLLQINASSILGKRGRGEQKITKYLLKEKLVSFVASDAHRIDKRRPNLIDAYQYLEKRISKAYLDKLFFSNANKIIKANKANISNKTTKLVNN